MATFKDTANREWVVQLNVSTIKRVKSHLGVNLLNVLDNDAKLLADLHDDLILLIDVIYVICMDQANARNITDEEFGKAFSGEVLAQAHECLFEELINFFPNPEQRKALGQVIKKMKNLAQKLLDHINNKLAASDDAAEAKKLIDSVSSLRASVE